MSFTFQEPIANIELNQVSNSLRIDQTNFPEAYVIRLLTGTVDFTCAHDNIAVQQRLNITNSLGSVNPGVTPQTLENCVSPLSLPELHAYLTEAGQTNRKFYENLLTEYCYFFYHTARESHTSAFVHVYRILEFISYSFPLLHATTNRSYYKTYDAFRSFFVGREDGELKFLRLFANKLFEGDPILATTADFNVVAPDPVLQAKIYNSFKRLFSGQQDFQFDDALSKFTIPYGRMIDAIVTLRNRYFHFATGGYQDNIASIDIGHPDSFFLNFNTQAATWLGMIYFEMLKTLCAG